MLGKSFTFWRYQLMRFTCECNRCYSLMYGWVKTLILLFLLGTLSGCSGSNSGSSGGSSSTITGGTFGTGNFVVTIADNSIPPNANAAPVATAISAVPADITVNSYETNVTSGAKAYTLKIGGTGFSTSTVGNVRLEVPFDRNLVPDKAMIDSLHMLLRILNADDNSVVTLTGQIVGDKVVADLTGFPSSATVTVLFNPNMDVATSDYPVAKSVPLTSETWSTRKWAVIYDAVEVAAEVQKFLEMGSLPTPPQIRSALKQQIADHAADAAATYQGEGFRSPALYVAKTAAEPGGIIFGTTPRYLLHFQAQEAANFTPKDPHELVGPDGNHYGRIYIQNTDLNEDYAIVGASVFGTVAHELFHAVQSGYDLSGKITLKGVREGTATAYGDLLDRRHNGEPAATPQVRYYSSYPTQIKDETFKLENYLLVTGDDAYSNQDFFVYLARTIGNNNYKYLATLFEQLRLTIEDEGNKEPNPAAITNFHSNPSLEAVYKGFDLFLSGIYGSNLLEVYQDFVQQRAIEHNTASLFDRPSETYSGLAADLFNNYASPSLKDVQIDPTSTRATTVNDLNPLPRLSTRVTRITPTAGSTGGDITVSVAPTKGTFGTTLSGWIYRQESIISARISSQLLASNSVTEFGADSSDEVIIILINPSYVTDGVGATIEISGKPGTISISPQTVTLQAGESQNFLATTTGTSNTSVIWSILEGVTGGTISSSGRYTAPNTAGTYHVVATSQANQNVNATATITVTEASQADRFNYLEASATPGINTGTGCGNDGAFLSNWWALAPPLVWSGNNFSVTGEWATGTGTSHAIDNTVALSGAVNADSTISLTGTYSSSEVSIMGWWTNPAIERYRDISETTTAMTIELLPKYRTNPDTWYIAGVAAKPYLNSVSNRYTVTRKYPDGSSEVLKSCSLTDVNWSEGGYLQVYTVK